MDKSLIYRFEFIQLGDRLDNVKNALPLLFLYIEIKDELNNVLTDKTKLSQMLGVSRHTIGDWQKMLSLNGILKYNFGKIGVLNPNLFFNGSKKNHDVAVKNWEKYKSVNADESSSV